MYIIFDFNWCIDFTSIQVPVPTGKCKYLWLLHIFYDATLVFLWRVYSTVHRIFFTLTVLSFWRVDEPFNHRWTEIMFFKWAQGISILFSMYTLNVAETIWESAFLYNLETNFKGQLKMLYIYLVCAWTILMLVKILDFRLLLREHCNKLFYLGNRLCVKKRVFRKFLTGKLYVNFNFNACL